MMRARVPRARRLLFVLTFVAVWVGSVIPVTAVPVSESPVTVPVPAMGVVEYQGHRLLAEIYLANPPAADEEEITRQALEVIGARPMTPEDLLAFGFTVSFPGGVTWGGARDHRRQDDHVVQYYNPANDPTDGGGLLALLNSHATWNEVRTSSFRFEFGGVTDRPTLPLDGFNDMSWYDFGFPDFLGITLTAFNETEIVESDVFMNTNTIAPGWATDDSDFDVESVMLHENGHVLGLGHSDDLNAVMFANYFPRGIARDLREDDIAGVSFLYPFGAAWRETNPPSTSGPFRLVAKLGDPVPQGYAEFEFEPGDLNDRGDVSFATDPSPPCLDAGYVGNECPVGEGIYINHMGDLTEVARGGRVAPGGGQYSFLILGRLDLDSAGNAAFAFTLDPIELPFGRNTGVFYYRRAADQTEAVVTPYVTQAPEAAGPFLGALNAVLNDRGQIAFAGMTETEFGLPGPAPLGIGVYLFHPNKGIEAVAVPGSPAPGGRFFDYAALPSINIQGDMTFNGHTTAEECVSLDEPTIFIRCYSSVYVRSARTGEIVRIAGQGDPAPGGGIFRTTGGSMINNQGYVVFGGDLTPAPSLGERTGIFLATPDGTIVPVVRPGDAMPGGGRVVTTGFGPPEFSINDRGEVAFTAMLDTHIGPVGFPNDMGVYVWHDGEVRLIARTGTAIPGIGTITSLLPPLVNAPFPLFSGGVINNRGEVLFQATLAGSAAHGVLLIATGGAVDPCYDGLDPNGEQLGPSPNAFVTESADYGTVLAAHYFGELCPESPTDLFVAEVPPDSIIEIPPGIPAVVEGVFGATLQFDPDLGDVDIQLVSCNADGCLAPLTPDESESQPGLKTILWHNPTDEPQTVAVEVTLTSGGEPAIPYSIETFTDLPDPVEQPPPPPGSPCGDEFPSDDGAFFESPGDYEFVGVVCPALPINAFFTELDQGFMIDTILTDPSTGNLNLSIFTCSDFVCEDERAIGESDDGGATQHASWTNCDGGPQVVLVGVSLADGEASVPFDMTIRTELDPNGCPG